jgi:hypothetical protein
MAVPFVSMDLFALATFPTGTDEAKGTATYKLLRATGQPQLEDQFYYRMTHVNERFCSSVQTFRANNASAKLIERGVLSTIFIAVAATLLVQALAGNNIRLIVVRVASRGHTHRRRR